MQTKQTSDGTLDEVLTIPEAARELELPERDVRAFLQDGTLRGKMVGGRWLTSMTAIDEFVEELDDDDEDEDEDDEEDDDEADDNDEDDFD